MKMSWVDTKMAGLNVKDKRIKRKASAGSRAMSASRKWRLAARINAWSTWPIGKVTSWH